MDYHGTDQDDNIDQELLKIADWSNIYGGTGDDKIIFGNAKAIGEGGNNTLVGTKPNSEIAYWNSPTGVVVNLAAGTASNGFGGTDQISGVQGVFGSGFSDQLIGKEDDNAFAGMGGSDTIVGGGGYDKVSYFFVKSSDAKISYDLATDTFTVIKKFPTGEYGTDTLSGISEIAFSGVGSDSTSYFRSNYTSKIQFSLAGIWPAFVGAHTNTAIAGPMAAQLPLGSSGMNGLALIGWAYQGSFGGSNPVVPINVALLDQQADGTLKLATEKYVTDPTTSGANSINIADFNGDGRMDIFLAAHNESPFVAKPSTVLMSNSNFTFDKLVLNDQVMAHDAQLVNINGKPVIFTRTYPPGDANPSYSYADGNFVSTSEKTSYGTVTGGMSVAVADLNNDGVMEMVIGDFDSGPGYQYFSTNKWVIGLYELSDVQQNTGHPLTTIVPYFSTNALYKNTASHWGVGMTHTYRVWIDDFNHDGLQDILAGQSLWTQSNPEYPSVLQMLQNKGSFQFADVTDQLNSDFNLNSEELDYSMQRIDLDRSGINSYLSGMWGAVTSSGIVRAANYLLLNDGTGHLHIALHDGFLSLTRDLHHYLLSNKTVIDAGLSGAIAANPSTVDRFIPYQLDDGSLNFLSVTSDLVLTNVPLHYNITTDYKTAVTIADRNNSMLMRTWAGNDTFTDTNANAAPAHINGGLGADTAIYSKASSTYQVSHNSDGSIKVTGNGIVDTLVNIERLQFADKKTAVDSSANGSAGETALLIGAVLPGELAFDKSKQALLGNVISLFDAGYSMKDLSGALLRLPIWELLTGKVAPTNTDIANYLLTNVNGHAPDQTTLSAGVAALNTETFQGTWLADLAAGAANQTHINLVGLQTTGLVYT